MNGKSIAAIPGGVIIRLLHFFLVLVLSLSLASSIAAQKKKKKDDPPPEPISPSIIASLPDEQRIDFLIGEWLGAWQLGDIEKLHKHVAEDISVVNGAWAPPVVGWTSYLAGYQQQRARVQQVRLDRSNTLIRIAPSGNVAWACYQWEFTAVVDGQPSTADGQTTLILEKRPDGWIIVHNHTSLVQMSQPAAPANPPLPSPPAKP